MIEVKSQSVEIGMHPILEGQKRLFYGFSKENSGLM